MYYISGVRGRPSVSFPTISSFLTLDKPSRRTSRRAISYIASRGVGMSFPLAGVIVSVVTGLWELFSLCAGLQNVAERALRACPPSPTAPWPQSLALRVLETPRAR